MYGNNPIRKPTKGDGTTLEVQEIFPTLQGEGPYTGWPAVFLRLGGCNLACSFCDTEFESFREMALAEIIHEIQKLAENEEKKEIRKLVVITGGEPMRQPIEKLCQSLTELGFKVQIETNGTIFRELPKEVDIVCSPKNVGGNYQKIRADLAARINAIKFIVSANDEKYQNIAEVGQSEFGIAVYVQPMDEYSEIKNRKNLELALELSQSYGAILSLQTHKILGIK